MTESAQLFKGVHDTPVYTDILFKKPLRLWVAVSLYGGAALTVVLTILTLDSGHARAILICGLLLTGAAAGGAALIPRGRPTLRFRIASWWRALRPDPGQQRQRPAAGATAHRHRQPELHRPRRLRPLPDQRTALLPAIHQTPHRRGRPPPSAGPRNPRRHMGFRAVRAPKPTPTAARHARRPPRQTPLGQRLPADGARHRRTNTPAPASTGWPCPSTPAAPGTAPSAKSPKLRDWVIGRDKDSDDSVAAYQRLAHDIITAIPEEFGPQPVSEDMIDWFWRHNAWRGVFNNPLPRRATTGQLDSTALPVAVFDDGDQLHHGGRALPLRTHRRRPGGRGRRAPASSCGPLLAAPPAALAAVTLLAWTAGIRRIPSWSKTLRVSSPAGTLSRQLPSHPARRRHAQGRHRVSRLRIPASPRRPRHRRHLRLRRQPRHA